MSGPYQVRCVLGEWQVTCGSFRAAATTDMQALSFADELNTLAARSGSPEGWPEGAELRTTAQILDEPGVWQVWNQPVIGDGSWTSIDEMTPGGLGVLGNCFPARRKPKPVTRDVRVEDVRGVVWLGSDGSDDDGPATIRPHAIYMDDDGATVAAVNFVRRVDGSWVDYLTLIAGTTLAVLVEEPNG